MNWLDVFAWAVAILCSVPLVVLAVECLVASCWRVRTSPRPTGPRVPCVVLIPAHNEELGLGRTLAALAPELGPLDRVLVVADNCTDRTSDIALSHGVEVVERFDSTRRGKGYALAFGVDCLRSNPPALVVILDADCVITPGSLARIVGYAQSRQRPVQAAYRMIPPVGAGGDRQVAAFAFLVKNVVRPLGLLRLGQPCLLTGTGMAFPWLIISEAKLGHGHIVEDMQLAVDLVIAGHPPLFVPEAEVKAEFPVGEHPTSSLGARALASHSRRSPAVGSGSRERTPRRVRVGPGDWHPSSLRVIARLGVRFGVARCVGAVWWVRTSRRRSGCRDQLCNWGPDGSVVAIWTHDTPRSNTSPNASLCAAKGSAVSRLLRQTPI